jgi:hypothetical protein
VGPVAARRHVDPVDAQQGAVADHERLPGRDLDRLLQGGRHRREQGERLADVAVTVDVPIPNPQARSA